MADNLPLIPGKRCVGDVRPVLRGVFRERAGGALPPLPAPPATPPPAPDGAPAPAPADEHEARLRSRRARHLARPSPPNTYRLKPAAPDGCCLLAAGDICSPDDDLALLFRWDLVPRIERNATRDTALWVKNILNESCEDVNALKVSGRRIPAKPAPLTPVELCRSEQSLSMGEVQYSPPPPPPPPPGAAAFRVYIACVPPTIDFINFTQRKLNTLVVHVVNMCKRELKVSLKPPVRRELDVQLCGRLKVTSGASLELRVHFTPEDVRAVYDEIVVRVSKGRNLRVPISCYMKPPIVELSMPLLTGSVTSCALGSGSAGASGVRSAGGVAGEGETLDLGARLLGDVHSSSLLLRCPDDHVEFFLTTEEAWDKEGIPTTVKWGGVLVAGSFAVSPAGWVGGGAVRGAAWCVAPHAGLHVASLRILCSTAIVRPLYFIADSIYFYPSHVTLQAQEKYYDINGEEDRDCEHYVYLGSSYAHLSAAAPVLLHNHSAVEYSFYWCVRPWRQCTCWAEEQATGAWGGEDDDSARLCADAREQRAAGVGGVGGPAPDEAAAVAANAAAMVRVEPAEGRISPRSSLTINVRIPDVGDQYGTQRAALILVLKDIPRRSFPRGFYPMVVSTSTVPGEHVLGARGEPRVLHDVVCCQLEVWWHVVPLRFTLDPPLLLLPHSRRVSSVELRMRAAQLFDGGAVHVEWDAAQARGKEPRGVRGARITLPAPLELQAPHPKEGILKLPLTELFDHYPVTDVIKLVEAEQAMWSCSARVTRYCRTRHPALRPVVSWLGCVTPDKHVLTDITVTNDTYEDIYWWADVFRWAGERSAKPVCAAHGMPCDFECEHACTCTILRPLRGALKRGRQTSLAYDVNAPVEETGVATLVRVRRTEADAARVVRSPPSSARAALIAYRVLGPHVTMRVEPCTGIKDADPGCVQCELEATVGGGGLLRPGRPLVAGLRTCYRLHFTNHTGVPTTITWQPPPVDDKYLHVIFKPETFEIGALEEIETRVVLEARRVCGRRVWAYQAKAHLMVKDIYLLVDALISGLEMDFWLPLPEYTFCLRRKQREQLPWHTELPRSASEAFRWDDERRRYNADHICKCKQALQWFPPKTPRYRRRDDPVCDIVETPPSQERVCVCRTCALPLLPAPFPLAIEVRDLPLRTVRTLVVRMRNTSLVTAHWRASMRLGARPLKRFLCTDVIGDPWAEAVRDAGLAARVSPARGVLCGRAVQELTLEVYADTWGLYRDQLLILTEGLWPLVVDVWVHVRGCPLVLPLRPTISPDIFADNPPMLWMSILDPTHTVRVRNTSKAQLLIQPFVLRDHENYQDMYPFRLCFRLFDAPPIACSCTDLLRNPPGVGSDTESDNTESLAELMATGVELYLAPDYGYQDFTHYKVVPEKQTVEAGACAAWTVAALKPGPPPHTLLLRILPTEPTGEWWFRERPVEAAVRVRSVPRRGDSATLLYVTRDRLTVHLCALALPVGDALRIRKELCVKNLGDWRLDITARLREEDELIKEPSSEASVFGEETCKRPDWGEADQPVGERIESEAAGEDGAEQLARESETAGVVAGVVGGVVAGAGVGVRKTPEWWLVVGARRGQCEARCAPAERAQRLKELPLQLQAHSSVMVTVEVRVDSADVWPAPGAGAAELPAEGAPEGAADQAPPPYEQIRSYYGLLQFYEDAGVIRKVPLVLELEVPRLEAAPPLLELGYVCDEDTRKTYFTVSHTSRTDTIAVRVTCVGGPEFRVSPARLQVAPFTKLNVYVMYSGRWTGAVCEGRVEVRAAGGAGAWCRAEVRVRARASRDYKCHLPPHDHTDDTALLPPTKLPFPRV